MEMLKVDISLMSQLFEELKNEHHAAISYDSDEYGKEHDEKKAKNRKRCVQCALLWRVRKTVLEPAGVKFTANGFQKE